MNDKDSPQQKIIEAVVVCIEKYGIDKLTTRKIAEEAGTNIASINYYFRSKDDLVAQTLGTTLQHMAEDSLAILQDEEKSFNTILKEWVLYLVEGARLYPQVFMAHMYAPVVEKNPDTPTPEVFRRMIEILNDRAVRAFPQTDAEVIRFTLAQIVSAVVFQLMAPNFFTDRESPSPETLADQYVALFTRVIQTDEFPQVSP